MVWRLSVRVERRAVKQMCRAKCREVGSGVGKNDCLAKKKARTDGGRG